MANLIIGFDNTDNKNAPITLNEDGGFIGCDIYDWAYDVTDQQIDAIKSGSAASVMLNLAGGSVEWFTPNEIF